MLPDFSQSYLNSICQYYAQWWRVYTLTDVVGQASIQRSLTLPLWDLGLRVQTIDHDKDPKTNESKTERFTVLEGLRKYAVDHVLLVGRPGSGKSTALAQLLIEEAQKAQQDSSALIPVLVELRYYQDSVLELMRSFFKTHGLLLNGGAIETLLFEGRFLLLVDGLNELPSEEARREVKVFEQTNRKTPMIFTTRDLGVGGDLNLTRKLEMQPLTEKQMQEFVRSYLPTQGDTLLRQLGDRLRELGQTPLLLLMLCLVFANNQNRVPSDLGSVFRQFTQLYDCKLKEDAPVAEGSREYWAEMLQVLAWKMTQGKSATELQVAIDRNEAIQVLKAFLTDKVAYPETCARTWLKDLLNHHLIQLGTGTQIEFRHQLIQEYYAAEQLLKQLPQLKDDCLKWDYLNYLKWTEPFALMLELVEDEQEALRVVRSALEVDWQLGARLAGKVNPEWQEKTIEMVRSLQLPQLFEIYLLGVTRSEAAIPALLKRIKHEDSSLHGRVAGSLGKIGSESAISALIELFKHEDFNVRGRAAEALGKSGSESAIPALIELLQDANSSVCGIAAEALGKIGSESAIPALIELLEHKSPDVRRRAAETLGDISSETAIPALIELLKREDSDVRGIAAETLGKIGSDTAIPVLIGLLQDINSDVRRIAAFALGDIGSDTAIPALTELLKHGDFFVCWSVTNMLVKIGSEASISSLTELLKHEGSSVFWNAIETLGRISSEASILSLTELLKHENSDVRRSAAFALGEIGSGYAIPVLIELLRHEDHLVRRSAAFALGEIGSESAIPALLECLKDKDSLVRRSAAFALGEIGSESAIPALLECLKDKDSLVCTSAAFAIGDIGFEEIIPLLIKLLKHENSSVCGRATLVLSKVGSEATIFQLKQHTKDEMLFTMAEIEAITAIQNRCKRYNAESVTSTEKPIVDTEAKTSGSQPKYTITAEVVQIIEKNDGEVIAKQSE